MLTDIQIKSFKTPGRYPDGNNLYLNVSRTLRKSWTCRLRVSGSLRKDIGLGSYPLVGLKEARQRCFSCCPSRVLVPHIITIYRHLLYPGHNRAHAWLALEKPASVWLPSSHVQSRSYITGWTDAVAWRGRKCAYVQVRRHRGSE